MQIPVSHCTTTILLYSKPENSFRVRLEYKNGGGGAFDPVFLQKSNAILVVQKAFSASGKVGQSVARETRRRNWFLVIRRRVYVPPQYTGNFRIIGSLWGVNSQQSQGSSVQCKLLLRGSHREQKKSWSIQQSQGSFTGIAENIWSVYPTHYDPTNTYTVYLLILMGHSIVQWTPVNWIILAPEAFRNWSPWCQMKIQLIQELFLGAY